MTRIPTLLVLAPLSLALLALVEPRLSTVPATPAASLTRTPPAPAHATITTLRADVPYGQSVDYTEPLASVQGYTEGGDRGFAALRTHQTYLGSHVGAQSANHDQAVFLGSGATGEGRGDFARSFSLIKKDWTRTSAQPGEGDVIRCDGRNGGPITGTGAGLSDMNCITINIQNIKGSGYLAGIEGTASDIDPAKGYAFDHNIGFQTGIVNSRDGSYEGQFVVSNNGANGVAYHASGSDNGSGFSQFAKSTAPCPVGTARFRLQDVFTTDTAGTTTWAPCPSAEATPPAISFGPDGAGALVVRNAAGTKVASIGQDGTVANATGQIAAYTSTSGSWATYTPSLSCSSGALNSAAASGRYQAMTNKILFLTLNVSISSNGSCSGALIIKLPNGFAVAPGAFGNLVGRENAKTGKTPQAFGGNGSETLQVVTFDNTYPGQDGAVLGLNGSFEMR